MWSSWWMPGSTMCRSRSNRCDPEIHDEMVRRKGAFKQTIAGLEERAGHARCT